MSVYRCTVCLDTFENFEKLMWFYGIKSGLCDRCSKKHVCLAEQSQVSLFTISVFGTDNYVSHSCNFAFG